VAWVAPPTDRQLEILRYVADRIVARVLSPTLREIGAHFGIRSSNGINEHLIRLEKKGLITRDATLSRALHITPQGWGTLGYKICACCDGKGMVIDGG
jgi:SOS-response transcriptional repressor LexA